MSGAVTVQINGRAYVGTLSPASPQADAELVARYVMGRWGFPECRGPHHWMRNIPMANLDPCRPRECAACGIRENQAEMSAEQFARWQEACRTITSKEDS